MNCLNVTNTRGSFNYYYKDDGAVITYFPGKGQKGWPQSTLVSVERAKHHMWEEQADMVDHLRPLVEATEYVSQSELQLA